MFISKSKYVAGCQCPKILWMDQHMPDQFDESVMNTAILTTGNEVGDLAMRYFGRFVEVPYERGAYADMARMTEELLAAGEPTICEATFMQDDCFCMVDILRADADGVGLIEVKSSTHAKDYHLTDIAFQLWLVERCGLRVKSASLMHLNPKYVRHGELDLKQLFVLEDVTDVARARAQDVPRIVQDLTRLCEQSAEPNLPLGPQCNSPFECGYRPWCWRDVPQPNVHQIGRLRAARAWELHEAGIVSFADAAAAIQAGALDLNPRQVDQVMAEVHQLDDVVRREEIRAFLDTLTYPLYYLDFETLMPAVPPYDGMRPYQQLPTQYSLHWQDGPGAAPQHAEFLAEPEEDPRRAIAERLCADIPLDACVVAYNMAFEKARLRELAERFPDLREHLMAIHDNMADLMVPFARGSYYSRAMQGSCSIKHVLPALFPDDPELDYATLKGVQNGGQAMDAYAALADCGPEEAARVREQLLRYCELDTFAMVKIVDKLRHAAAPDPPNAP